MATSNTRSGPYGQGRANPGHRDGGGSSRDAEPTLDTNGIKEGILYDVKYFAICDGRAERLGLSAPRSAKKSHTCVW
jgi:hypothetical protein